MDYEPCRMQAYRSWALVLMKLLQGFDSARRTRIMCSVQGYLAGPPYFHCFSCHVYIICTCISSAHPICIASSNHSRARPGCHVEQRAAWHRFWCDNKRHHRITRHPPMLPLRMDLTQLIWKGRPGWSMGAWEYGQERCMDRGCNFAVTTRSIVASLLTCVVMMIVSTLTSTNKVLSHRRRSSLEVDTFQPTRDTIGQPVRETILG